MKSYISITLSKCCVHQKKSFRITLMQIMVKKLNSKTTNQITIENPNESKDSKRKTERLENQKNLSGHYFEWPKQFGKTDL